MYYINLPLGTDFFFLIIREIEVLLRYLGLLSILTGVYKCLITPLFTDVLYYSQGKKYVGMRENECRTWGKSLSHSGKSMQLCP